MSATFFWAAFAVRSAATAAIVILATLAIGSFGPVIGGAIAGLPMVIGPGFLFLILDHEPTFVAAVAGATLASLCGTQGFILAYVVLARAGPLVALLAASAVWIVIALFLTRLALSPVAAALCFALVTLAARLAAARFRFRTVERAAGAPLVLVILRGLGAGLLVGAATLLAHVLGPDAAGVLLAFPIGFATVALGVHSHHGPAMIVETGYAAILGMTSLAVFAFSLIQGLGAMPPGAALALALAASLAFTGAMAALAGRRAP